MVNLNRDFSRIVCFKGVQEGFAVEGILGIKTNSG